MPQWLQDLIREVVTMLVKAELEKHGVLSTTPPKP
jgi:hypothetical protein